MLAMKKIAVALNWMMIGLFGVAFIGLGVQYPDKGVGNGLILLLPYASALLALKSRPRRVLIGSGILLNVLVAVVSVVYVWLGVEMGNVVKAIVAGVLLLSPPIVNCVVLKRAWGEAAVARKLSEDGSGVTLNGDSRL
jgi:hypothetical protein